MSKQKPKTYQQTEEQISAVNEPAATYGHSPVIINPDKLYSYADYLTWMDDKRREIYNGVVWMMSGPNRIHSLLSTNIAAFFKWFVRKEKGQCEIFHAPFDVRLPKESKTRDDQIYTVVQPDICVVCDSSKLDDKGCIGAPDLVVEVLSPSTAKKDLDYKFHLYEEAGVREYWVVYPDMKAVSVFTLEKNGLFDPGTTYEYDAIVPSTVLKGLKIELKELFEG